MTEITPEEELAHFEEMYKALKRSTPSAPDWYHIIDLCLGTLMAHKLEEIKRKL